MKNIVIYVCSIIISIMVLASCNSKTSNTPDTTASTETVYGYQKESIDGKTESIPVESEVSVNSEASLGSEVSSESGVSSDSDVSVESSVSTETASIYEQSIRRAALAASCGIIP